MNYSIFQFFLHKNIDNCQIIRVIGMNYLWGKSLLRSTMYPFALQASWSDDGGTLVLMTFSSLFLYLEPCQPYLLQIWRTPRNLIQNCSSVEPLTSEMTLTRCLILFFFHRYSILSLFHLLHLSILSLKLAISRLCVSPWLLLTGYFIFCVILNRVSIGEHVMMVWFLVIFLFIQPFPAEFINGSCFILPHVERVSAIFSECSGIDGGLPCDQKPCITKAPCINNCWSWWQLPRWMIKEDLEWPFDRLCVLPMGNGLKNCELC